MQLGLGVLGWSPKEFWGATITELYSGIEGWQECNGIEQAPKAPTIDELRNLMERFPDGEKK